MKKILFALVLLATLYIPSLGQPRENRKLKSEIQSLLQGFKGDVGIYVLDIKRNKSVDIRADSIFPTASMIKLPILLGVSTLLNEGTLKDTQHLVYHDSLLYEGVDILGSFKSGEQIELQKLIMLMLTMSDNTASLWLQSLAGGGTRINELLQQEGFEFTRVNSRTPGRENARSVYGWGQTTPREMVRFMEKLYHHQLISREASERMLRQTSRNFWDEEALSQVPAGIFVSSKGGAVNASRSEVLLVYAPRRPYIFCITTKNNQDESWTNTNEAWVMTRKVSALLWNYFGN